MKITLISPHGSIIAYGLRMISACLQKAGHQVRMIFLSLPEEIEPIPGWESPLRYDPEVMTEILDLCRDSDLIGISLSTVHFFRTADLTEYLKKHLDVPIIWGGIHPTLKPEECLEYADILCRGEGETAVVELSDRLREGSSYADVGNLALRREDGSLQVNPLYPLIQDLDQLPYPDYRTQEHYILHGGHIVPMTPALSCWYLTDGYTFGHGSAYHIWATRGCPHSCAYCCNNYYASLYPGWTQVRRMSNKRIVAEIKTMQQVMPFISEVAFMDDTFFSASTESIQEFASFYREELGLPFFCCATPATINQQKMEAMTAAGLRYIWLGIQSGSPRVQEIYQRYDRPERILETARILNQYVTRILPPMFDILLDQVFQTPKDQVATLRLLDKMPYPFHLAVYSLTFFPGADITARALKDGLIKSEEALHYEKNIVRLERTLYRILLWAYGRNIHKIWLRPFTYYPIYRALASCFFQPLWCLLGRWLDRREGRQMIKWTLAHRKRVLTAEFPGSSLHNFNKLDQSSTKS